MAASCEAKDTLRLINAFRKSFDKLRAGLQLEIKPLNSILYSKGLISGEVRMKDDIDITLSAISLRLENADVTKSTFFGFAEAVSQIDSKMHLKTMLECHANDSTSDRGIIAAGVHISGTASSEQAWQKNLETSRDSAIITSSVENFRSVSWRQVIDEENSHSHSADHNSESGNMPNVSVEYVRELEEKRIPTLEATIKAMEAHNLKQALYEEVREKAHKDKTRLTEEKILQAEEKALQAEKKASQAAERAFQAEKQLNALQLNEDDQDFEVDEEEWEEAHQQDEEEWEEEAHQQDEEEWEEEEAHQQDEEEWEDEEEW